MLPKFFVQTELNNTLSEHKKVKLTLFFSYLFKTLSFVFVYFAFRNTWYLIGFVLIYSGGIVLRQLVLEMISHYEYFLVNEMLKISVVNNFKKYKLLAEIPLNSIIEISEIEQPIINENEVFAMPIGKKCVKICYKTNGKVKTLYFSPSRYLLALINDYICTKIYK